MQDIEESRDVGTTSSCQIGDPTAMHFKMTIDRAWKFMNLLDKPEFPIKMPPKPQAVTSLENCFEALRTARNWTVDVEKTISRDFEDDSSDYISGPIYRSKPIRFYKIKEGPLKGALAHKLTDGKFLTLPGTVPETARENGATQSANDESVFESTQLPSASESISAESRAEKKKKTKEKWPRNPDAKNMIFKMRLEIPKGKTKSEIARNFTGETLGHSPKADSLMRTLRNYLSLLPAQE